MSETHPPGAPADKKPGFSTLVIHREDAEFLGAGSDTIALLADASATGGLLGVSRTTLGHGRNGATPHYHRGSAELLFVLDGRLQVLAGEEVVEVEAGGTLVVPPQTIHAFAALPGAGADVLIVITPGVERFAYFRLLERVRQGRADPQDLLAFQDRFDTHFVDSIPWRRTRAAA
ncbi:MULTISPECIES: cupin domain-containing protein [unclassified Streptomyces]|uniref:cupin domain-containing protein n=1 Tax=unclassified Streptomyces TaxID=2593676 RepID=UPI00081DF056|nr:MULTISPECIES: cupin domain-containing protein [unclassified Streptomyces]MYZ34126.1 cupin domain-containing protein [Streptomyces sp. SID4917]SCF64351.1 Cupin domain-containing protein [Streptomyces sp. MnatMP-M17]